MSRALLSKGSWRKRQPYKSDNSTSVLFDHLSSKELSCRKKQYRTEKRNQNPSCVCFGDNRNVPIRMMFIVVAFRDSRDENPCRYRGPHMPVREELLRPLLLQIRCERGSLTGGGMHKLHKHNHSPFVPVTLEKQVPRSIPQATALCLR
jgi:hypothetical protein